MNTVKIGWGLRTLSMDVPMSLPGQMYIRISERIHDPLCATALCVDGGEGQDAVIFCTCDVVVLRGGVIAEIKQKVAQIDPRVPVDAIILGATHTHAGGCVTKTAETTPDGQKIYPGSAYSEFFCKQAAEAICEAWNSRTEGGMAYGYGYAVVAHSRRVCYIDDVSLRMTTSIAPNGHAVMYGNTRDDMFSHYEAGADHFLNAMFTFNAEKKVTGVVVNVPCPSQLSEHFRMQSADFWNEVREAVKKEFGEDVYVLPQCAAAGDLSPRVLHYKQAQARRMGLKYGLGYDPKLAHGGSEEDYKKVMSERYDIAERIMNALRDIYSWASKDIQTQVVVAHECQVMALKRRFITEEEKTECEETVRKMKEAIPEPGGDPMEYRKAVSWYNSIKSRNERAVERFHNQDADPTLDTTVHVARIGDIAFATNRFELYMDFMHRLQARSPFIQTFVIQLAGDENGSYLATERGAANKGYSASMFCNLVSAEGGQQWVEGSLEILNRLAEK